MSTNNKKAFKKFNNLKQVGPCYHKSCLQHKLNLTTLFLARFHAIINHFTINDRISMLHDYFYSIHACATFTGVKRFYGI